ncbi:MAG: MarR family winged helix-turn-helix transcriptional regulator [Desulfovibrio sp.]
MKSAGYRFAVMHRLNMALHAEGIEEIGIRPSQIPFLAVLMKCGHALTQEELSEVLVLDKAAVARGVLRLEKDGYLFRESNPDDRRQKLVSLTAKGLGIRQNLLGVLQNSTNTLTEGFSQEELEQFLSLMDKAIANGRSHKYGRCVNGCDI